MNESIPREQPLEIEALIKLLDEKGIITQDELMEKCKSLRDKIRGR